MKPNQKSNLNFLLELALPHKLIFLFYAIFLIAGLILGQQFSEKISSLPKLASLEGKEIRLNKAGYTNPLLECNMNETAGETEYKPSRKKIADLINRKKENGEINDVSVYYRDLNNGPWFGINEKEYFTPASLLKLPVMMAYFKKAESDPSLLKKEILYEKPLNPARPSFLPENSIEPGKSYTIDELIEKMIIDSDNNALSLLEQNIENSSIDTVTIDLGIETANENTPEDFMSVKSYASLLRVLYNASYLSRNDSEKALSILSKISFDQGLNRGLPQNIQVAHKFGERELENGTRQLHDCGIIYYPKRPYLLCVMTRGSDYTQMSSVIGEISSEIYSDINNRYKK